MPLPETFIRTRLAPTPSGYLHLGNIASFVLTLGLARKFGAKVLLRIDDLDAGRARDEYLLDIFQTLEFLGLPWDEGPRNISDFKSHYSQQLRLPLYQQALDSLRERQLVFACDCSRSTILRYAVEPGYPGTCLKKGNDLTPKDTVWRLNNFPDGKLIMNDLRSGKMESDYPDSQRYLSVRKKDGDPSYQLASVLDDQFFKIDLVVRGADLLESTLAQLYLAEQTGATEFRKVYFVHHPLLAEDDGSKMSKSAGAKAVKTFREKGESPADVFRAIARHFSWSESPESWQDLAALFIREWVPETLSAGQNR